LVEAIDSIEHAIGHDIKMRRSCRVIGWPRTFELGVIAKGLWLAAGSECIPPLLHRAEHLAHQVGQLALTIGIGR
jgi:hypothetical protein